MELNYFPYRYANADYRFAYWTAGDTDSERILICVHGLLRHSFDFYDLVQALSRDARVICIDLPGRGRSDWLPDADAYTPETYVEILAPFVAQFAPQSVDWIGTSLGGLLGMAFAAMPQSSLRTLVLNDIGAEIPAAALKRIASYIEERSFTSQAELIAYLKGIYPGLRDLSEPQWQRLAEYGSRRGDGAEYALHYDPAIGQKTRQSAGGNVELWPLWEAVSQPVLLFHGVESDILTPQTVARMARGREQFSVIEVPGVGHVPSLMVPEQIVEVARWLNAVEAQ